MALLRSRLLGGQLLLGSLLWVLTLIVTPGSTFLSIAIVALSGLAICGAVLVLRASRIGPREFWLWLLVTQTFAMAYQAALGPAMPRVPLELAFVGQLIMGAAFCVTRAQVVVLWVAASVAIVVVAVARLGMAPDLGNVVGTEIPIFMVIALTVRVLREVAYDSLVAAKAGELTDPLTGLANRRALERNGRACWSEQADAGQPLTFLVLDIDHFKHVNDTLGHAAGDELIRRVAELLTTSIRPGDMAVRLGGEEFLLMARATAVEGAIIAERLRALFERQLHPVTVSIGVCEARPDPTDAFPVDLWRAVDVADQALYQAKRGGRNRVVSGPEPGLMTEVLSGA